jgi:hypothetical protein
MFAPIAPNPTKPVCMCRPQVEFFRKRSLRLCDVRSKVRFSGGEIEFAGGNT